VIWLLALLDLAAGGYLLGWSLRRERRDKDAVLAVGMVVLLCGLLLAGLGGWQLTQEPPRPVVPGEPATAV
jgi:hypothetical protein